MFSFVRAMAWITFVLLTTIALAQDSGENSSTEENASVNYNEAYYFQDAINANLPDRNEQIDLSTPLSTIENFILSCQNEQFDDAAHSLNLKLQSDAKPEDAAKLARQFYYALNQRLWIDIEDLPDRPDGQVINRVGSKSPLAGEPRRSIRLGVISIDDWKEVRVRIQRVKAEGAEPVWLFSPQTVEKIPELYEAYGPSWIEEWMPSWAKTRVVGKVLLWEWLALIVFLCFGVVLGYFAQRLVRFAILHRKRAERLWFEQLLQRLAWPIGLASGAFAVYLLKSAFLSLTAPVNSILDPAFLLLVIGSIAWLVLRGLDSATRYTMEHYVNTFEDDEVGAEQGLLTKISVARRLLTMIAVFTVVGIVLVQFDLFDAVGYGLIASAGVSTVILGIAAQPILGNLLAGLQIALTQPVRIGDSVLFEGNWGRVESISFTYLTIRTWDKRRLIVPLTYLLSKPVENWTKTSADLIQPVKVYVDYAADVGRIRDKFHDLVAQHELADDEAEPTVQVTGCSEETMEVRGLCHAKSPGDAWDLHCDIREDLIAYLQEVDDGAYLPQERIRLKNRQPAEHTNGQES